MSDATNAAPGAAPAPGAPAAPAPAPINAAPGAAPAPAPAPAAAPAPAPSEVVAVEAPPAAAQPDGSFTYEATGNPALDVALNFFGKLGIGPDSVAAKQAMAGDFTLLAAELATKGDKALGWQQHVDLAKKALDDAVTSAKAVAAEVSKAATEAAAAVGSDWPTIQTWARQNADPSERAWFNGEIQKGGVAARAAINYVTSAYANANGTTQHPPSAADPNRGAGNRSTASAGISAKEYAQGVAALHAKSGGRDVTKSPEYQALQAQRLLGRRMGK